MTDLVLHSDYEFRTSLDARINRMRVVQAELRHHAHENAHFPIAVGKRDRTSNNVFQFGSWSRHVAGKVEGHSLLVEFCCCRARKKDASSIRTRQRDKERDRDNATKGQGQRDKGTGLLNATKGQVC